MSDNNIYANVNPTEVNNGAQQGAFSSQYQGAYGQPGQPGQAGFGGQGGYAGQPGYGAQSPYGTPVQPNYAYNNVIKYPGKEITSMVFGINALVWGVFGIFFCWHIVLAIVYGLMSISFGVVALVLRNQVYSSNATVFTGKANIGKKLGTAGIICGASAIVLSIIVIFIIIAAAGSSAVYSILAS